MNTGHTHLKITSHHTSLADAVATAKPDLSYNEQEAKNRIQQIDRNCKQAMVTEDGEIYYVFNADIQLLHKFEPFMSCLDNTPFRIAFVVGDTLSIGEPSVPKTPAGREFFKKQNVKFGALAA